MKNTHKHSFEDEFKKAFEEAEAEPSSSLWAEIDAHLANQEADKYKRKLYFFKLRAAAAAVLVFGFLGIWLMNSNNTVDNPVAVTNNQKTNLPAQASQQSQEKTAPSNADISTSNGSVTQQESSVSGQSIASNAPNKTLPQIQVESNKGLDEKKQANQENNTSSNASLALTPETVGTLNADAERLASGKRASKPGNKSLEVNPKTSPSDNNTIINGLAKNSIAKDKLLNENRYISSVRQKENTSNSLLTAAPENENPLSNTSGFNSYALDRLNTNFIATSDVFAMQVPVVRLKPNQVFIEIEEEEEENEKKSASSRWSVALAFTPNQFDPNMKVYPNAATNASLSNFKSGYSNYNYTPTLQARQNSQNGAPVGKDLQDAESFGMSYNVGVNVQYALSEKFSLQSGLQYMHNNSQITTDNYLENFSNREKYPAFLSVLDANNTAANFIAQNNAPLVEDAFPASPALNGTVAGTNLNTTYAGVTEVLVENTYQYLSVPMRLHYKLTDKKLSTSIGAGLSADVFMKNTVGNTEANVSVVEYNRKNNPIYRNVGISGLVSAKLDYHFSERYSLYIEPSYRSALTSFTKSGSVRSMPNAFGIGTGFQYRF